MTPRHQTHPAGFSALATFALALLSAFSAVGQSDPFITARPDFQNRLYLTTPTNAPGNSLAQPASIALFSGSAGAAGDVRTPNDGLVNLVQAGIGQGFFLAASSPSAPTLAVDLTNLTVAAYGEATLSVMPNGTPPFSYQWYRNGFAVMGASNISLTFNNTQPANAGSYTVIVSNAFGSVTSQVATLSVETTLTRILGANIVSDVGNFVSCSWADFNNDGHLDLFVAQTAATSLLYSNNGNGTFTKILAGPVVSRVRDSNGAAWGDYDNDGYPDLFVANFAGQKNFLYHNNGNGSFTEVTNGPVATDVGNSYSAAWADYDQDGWLDLFVTNEGQPSFLYHNNGDGKFTRITNGSIATNIATSTGCAWSDLDNDGWPDLFVANYQFTVSHPFIYRNNHDGTFSEITSGDIYESITAGACAWGDFDNDGFFDLYVSNEGLVETFFRNNHDGTFTRLAGSIPNANTSVPRRECTWGDYDNDGFQDLFVANAADTDDLLYRNKGDGTFAKVTVGSPVQSGGSSTAAAWSDYDNDGSLDLFVSNYSNQANFLYHNNGNSNTWLTVKCRGTASNRSGIGVVIRVQATIGGVPRLLSRLISGGSGYQGGLRAHFGLGDATNIDLLRIEWPSGIVQTFSNVAPRQTLTIAETTPLYFAVNGSGSLSYSPVKSNYFIGEPITLTATPRNTNWTRFLRWSDGNTNAIRTITVGLTNQFTAIFTNFVALEELVFQQWEKTFGGIGDDYAKIVRSTGDGGFILGGHSNSPTNDSKTTGTFGGRDYWVLKLDASGGKLWERGFGGGNDEYVRDIVVTGDGGFLLVGYSSSEAATGNKTVPRFGNESPWLIKLDANGNEEWQRGFGANHSNTSAESARQTADGGFVFVGSSGTPGTGMWLVKLDAGGNQQWDQTYGSPLPSGALSVVLTQDGGYFLGGGYRSSPAESQLRGLKVDANGVVQADGVFGGSGDEIAVAAVPGGDGGHALLGYSASPNDGSKSAVSFGGSDYWLVRLDAGGNKLWDRSFGGSLNEEPGTLQTTPDGGFIIGGYSASSTSGNKSHPGFGARDGWVVKTDAAGTKQWELSLGGMGNDEIRAAQVLPDGYLLAGYTESTNGSGTRVTPSYYGGQDYWLVKLVAREAPVGTPVVLVNGNYSPSNFFTIPATNTITVEIQTTFANASVFYTLDDSDPSSGELYGGPLVISNSVFIRVIAFNEDFFESQVGDPVRIDVVPLYPLAFSTPGGGSIAANPPSGPHLSNSVVRLTATSLPGWSFLHWTNDATGTNPVLDVTMDRAKTVQAVFGSGLSVTVTGNGTVQRAPTQSLYPFGTTVRLTPIPSAANAYFRQWGSAAAGQFVAPLSFVMTNPNPTVSAIFAVLTGTQRSLTVNISGEGTVTKTPQQSNYANNASVTLTAAPAPGHVFATWSGDSDSTSNPLTLVMNTNKTVTANFTRPPVVIITGLADEDLLTTADFQVAVSASDVDGTVARVDLFDGSRFIATLTAPPFDFVLNNAAVGAHTLRAVATDNLGAMATNQIKVTVSVPPPVIASFSPQTGPTGSVVTIAGANFAANPADNIVYFGGVRTSVLNGTTNSLMVTVPSGPAFATLTVTAHGLAAYSASPFVATFNSTRVVDAGAFAPKSDLNCGGAPSAVALGDLDGDGKLDIVVTSAAGFDGYLSVYRNTGTNSRIASEAFGPRVDLAGLSRFNQSVALADVDGDGKLDIITTVYAGGPGPNLFVLKNVSAPGTLTSNSFATPVAFHTGNGPQGVVVSDLDGDGKPDIIVANTDDDSISVFRNTGQAGVIDTNSFTAIPVTFPAVEKIVSVVVMDLDRDGKPDLAGSGASTNIIAFRNVTAGPGIAGNSFSTGVNFLWNGSAFSAMSMAVGDFDGDDRPEIVQMPYVSSGSRLAVHKNISAPGSLTPNSFAPPVQFVTPASMWAVAIGDMDGDGKPDLVTTSEGAQSVRVMKNTSVPGSISASSFADAISFDTGVTPEAVAIGDLDGDGRPDMVVASTGSASLSLFWNTIPFSLPPSVVLVSPTNGSSFNTPATIELSASATDSDGTVTNVSFYFAGINFIGQVTNAPFNFTWNNVSAGSYSLTAVATDNTGLSATSAPPVNITVSTVNQPPLVSLVSPTNGSVFAVGANIIIAANAFDQGGSVTLVEFFAGASLVGSDATEPYSLVWSNAPAGSFTLTARATDNLGAQGTSPGVGVIITSFATNAPVFSWSNLVVNVAEASPSVTLHLFKSANSVAANIGYSTRDGSARAGGDVPDYVAVVSNLTFAAGETVRAVSIPILQDGLNESNHFFFVTLSPPTEGSIANGNEAQVVILDDDIPGTNSFLQSLAPSLPPTPLGSLRVNLSPTNIFAQWRLGWEVAWRDAGSLVRGLPQGNYEIEFKPVAGYREPLSAVVPVLGGVTNDYAFVYPASQSSQVGSLMVTLQPSLVAMAVNLNERGQWRLQGEGAWRDSGGRIDGLPAGSHIVEFKQLTNTSPWVKPASLLVTVQANAESRPVGYYYVANTSPGEGPRVLDFENEIKLGLAPPYAFVGQILSDVGWGSGTVVKEKVVLTAAHVVFDDRELAYVPNYGVSWFFQRQASVYEPGPQTPRGWFVQGGYAAQRTVEGTPGASAPASQELDIAALYFVGETAGRGGYSGYLVSGGDERINAALLATIVGYPVEGVSAAQVGQMHATPLKRLQWDTALAPHVFATTNVKAFPGNSGGPVFIQHTDARWYPAAIFLGGSGKTVARVIDGAAAGLIIAAEQASNTDVNNTGGEPPFAPNPMLPPPSSFGYLDVYLQPTNIGAFGGGYRFRNTTNEVPHSEPYLRYQLRGGVQVTLDFIPAAGHLAPLPMTASVQSGRTNSVAASYRAWGGVAMDGGLLRLVGSSGGVYRIDYKTNLSDAIWRSVRTQTFNGAGLNVTNLVPGATNGFFRAVLLP